MQKNTDDLMKILGQSPDAKNFITNNSSELLTLSLTEYLEKLLKDKKMKKSDVIRDSALDKTYAYQIFDGKRKPSRDKLLQLAFGFGLTVDETQNLLKIAREAVLYPRVERDIFILAALHNKSNLSDCDEMLEEHGFKQLESKI